MRKIIYKGETYSLADYEALKNEFIKDCERFSNSKIDEYDMAYSIVISELADAYWNQNSCKWEWCGNPIEIIVDKLPREILQKTIKSIETQMNVEDFATMAKPIEKIEENLEEFAKEAEDMCCADDETLLQMLDETFWMEDEQKSVIDLWIETYLKYDFIDAFGARPENWENPTREIKIQICRDIADIKANIFCEIVDNL